jgi:hypothetical protein
MPEVAGSSPVARVQQEAVTCRNSRENALLAPRLRPQLTAPIRGAPQQERGKNVAGRGATRSAYGSWKPQAGKAGVASGAGSVAVATSAHARGGQRPVAGVGSAGVELQELSPACGEPGTDTAQRFLTSAFESVEAVFQTLRTVRRLRREETGDISGRLTSPEEDLLRAAVVFTGAALSTPRSSN